MLRKFRVAVFAAAVLWLIVLVQIITTRIYVSQTGFAQAFARNQVTVLQEESQQQNADSRNAENGNICTEGVIPGRLTAEEMEQLAQDLFRSLGGGRVFSGRPYGKQNYYVAYGYTTGLSVNKKVNGKRINMNVAISYDEKKNVTNVILGSPIVNTDF